MFFRTVSFISFILIVLFGVLFVFNLKTYNKDPVDKKIQQKITFRHIEGSEKKLVDKAEMEQIKDIKNEEVTKVEPLKTPAVESPKETSDVIKDAIKKEDAKPIVKKFAILLYGLGTDSDLTKRIVEDVPSDVMLAFSPYTVRMQAFIATMIKKKFFYGLDLPLEEADYPTSYGSLTLIKDITNGENNARFDEIMKNIPNANFLFFGVKEVFSSSSNQMAYLLEKSEPIKPTFIYQENYLNSFLKEALASKKMPSINSYFYIPENISKSKFKNELERIAEQIKLGKENILVAIKAEPHIIAELIDWLNSMEKQGFRPSNLEDFIKKEEDKV
jgi:polysaccharide deacetylase 2 family uncharacterized protein YibQ